MKIGLIAIVTIAVLLLGTFSVMALTKPSTITKTSSGCGSCNGSCTAEKNCGLAGCEATTGGSCTCGKTTTSSGCGSCNGSCTAEKSCGATGCGTTTGGSCGCKKA